MDSPSFQPYAAAVDATAAFLCREAGLDPDNPFERECMMDTVFECADVGKRYSTLLAQFLSTALQMAAYDNQAVD